MLNADYGNIRCIFSWTELVFRIFYSPNYWSVVAYADMNLHFELLHAFYKTWLKHLISFYEQLFELICCQILSSQSPIKFGTNLVVTAAIEGSE